MTKKLLLGLVAAAMGCAPAANPQAVKMVPDRATTAQVVGRMPRNQRLTIVLGTKLHDADQMDQTIAQVQAGVARALTASEFGARYSVDDAAYDDLILWATSNGLTIVRKTPSHTTLTVSGTIEQLENALGLAFNVYKDAKGTFYAPNREPIFDQGALANLTSISGLSNARGGWYSKSKRIDYSNAQADGVPSPAQPDAVPTPVTSGYTMANLQSLYNWPSTATASKAHVAILGVGAPLLSTSSDPYNAPAGADIASYLGTTAAPANYKQVQVGDSDAADPGDDGTWIENTLDAEMVLTFAPAAQVDHVLVVDNAYGLFSDGISYIVNDASESSAQVVSVSYGSCEQFYASEIPVENALFAQAMAQGQQWFFASGDTGVDVCNDGSNITTPTVDWPASSPYVFAIGGTQVYKSGSAYKEEAWGGTSANGGGGGGGVSAMFAKPTWQTGKTINDGARDLPDMSALAGSPGVNVHIAGIDGTNQNLGPISGTSAATPMWAGIWADLVSANGGKGFAQGPTDIYTLAPTGGLTDITAGSNGIATCTQTSCTAPTGTYKGYNAGTGYDLATGLGTPNITTLLTQTNWK